MGVRHYSLDEGRVVGDRRREGLGGYEEVAARLQRRAGVLEPKDRALICMYLSGELRVCRVAELMGVWPSTLSRRIQRFIRRLRDPLVAALMEREDGALPERYRQVGLEVLLHGRPKGQVGRAMGMTRREVDDAMVYVKVWGRMRG